MMNVIKKRVFSSWHANCLIIFGYIDLKLSGAVKANQRENSRALCLTSEEHHEQDI